MLIQVCRERLVGLCIMNMLASASAAHTHTLSHSLSLFAMFDVQVYPRWWHLHPKPQNPKS